MGMAAAQTARDTTGDASPRRERLGAAAVYAAGAVLYFIARESLGLNFLASPLFYGVLVLAASYFRPRLLASAVILVCWGIAVLVDGNGPLAGGRTAQVHVAGFGVGALACLRLGRWIPARVALESVAIIMIVVGVWYYFVEEYAVLERAWLWSAVFLANAAGLAGSALWVTRPVQAQAGEREPGSDGVCAPVRHGSRGVPPPQ